MSERKESEQPQSGGSSSKPSNQAKDAAGQEKSADAVKETPEKPEVAEKVDKVKEKMHKAKEALVSTTQQVVATVKQEASGPFVEEAKRSAAAAKANTKEVLMRSPEIRQFTEDILYGGASDAVSISESVQQPEPAVPHTPTKKSCQR